jgi:hypothetical protein
MITRTHTASSVSSTIARENVPQVPDEEPYGAECTPVSVSDRSSAPTLTSSQAKVCSFSPRAIASSRVLGAAAVDAHGATVPVDEVTASPGRRFAEPDRDAVSHHVDVGGADLDAPRTQGPVIGLDASFAGEITTSLLAVLVAAYDAESFLVWEAGA